MILCLVLLICIIPMLPFIQASEHFCVNEYRPKFDIDTNPEQSEKFFSTISATNRISTNQLQCTWVITLPSDPSPRAWMLVIRGFNATTYSRGIRKRSVQLQKPESPKLHYRLVETPTSTDCSSHATHTDQSVDSVHTFHVVPLMPTSSLTVKYSPNASLNEPLPPGLWIELMHEGFCSSDIVSFEKKCYRRSEIKRTLEEELRLMNQDSKVVQLASFNSISAIRQFLNASRVKRVGPRDQRRRKVPLDLTQPVRIGLFLDKKAGRISYLNASNGGCLLMDIDDQVSFPFADNSTDPTHACGSLRANESGMEVVEFRNCNEPLPALISFAETPMERCSNWTEPVLSWLSTVSPDADEGRFPRPLSSSSVNLPMLLVLVLAVVATSCAVTFLAVVFCYKKGCILLSNCKRRHQPRLHSVPEATCGNYSTVKTPLKDEC